VRQESFTRIPGQIVAHAEREYPHVPIGEFFERALRRIGKSSPAERKRLIELGKPFSKDLASWVRCPYSIDSTVWDGFVAIVEKRKENPGAILAGALMAELGMASSLPT
jgi:hypothetical protein